MRFYEFSGASTQDIQLVAVVDQLKTELENGDQDIQNMTTDDLLDYLSSQDIVMDKTDLYELIKKPPMSNLIKNIQGDKIVFKGEEDNEQQPDDDTDQQNVVKSMADQART